MSIDYALYPNPVTENPNDCRAVVKNKKVMRIDDIIQKMIDDGIHLNESDIECIVKQYTATIIESLSNGYSIATPVMSINPKIKGNFLDESDNFHPDRHKIDFDITLGKALHFDTKDMSVNKVKAHEKAPVIMEVSDYFSETVNTKISPNGSIEITGLNLKIDKTKEDEGLFFISDEMIIKAEKFYHNRNTYLVAKIPSALKGKSCKIEVKKRNPCCPELLSYTYDIEFIVTAPCLSNIK